METMEDVSIMLGSGKCTANKCEGCLTDIAESRAVLKEAIKIFTKSVE